MIIDIGRSRPLFPPTPRRVYFIVVRYPIVSGYCTNLLRKADPGRLCAVRPQGQGACQTRQRLHINQETTSKVTPCTMSCPPPEVRSTNRYRRASYRRTHPNLRVRGVTMLSHHFRGISTMPAPPLTVCSVPRHQWRTLVATLQDTRRRFRGIIRGASLFSQATPLHLGSIWARLCCLPGQWKVTGPLSSEENIRLGP